MAKTPAMHDAMKRSEIMTKYLEERRGFKKGKNGQKEVVYGEKTSNEISRSNRNELSEMTDADNRRMEHMKGMRSFRNTPETPRQNSNSRAMKKSPPTPESRPNLSGSSKDGGKASKREKLPSANNSSFKTQETIRERMKKIDSAGRHKAIMKVKELQRASRRDKVDNAQTKRSDDGAMHRYGKTAPGYRYADTRDMESDKLDNHWKTNKRDDKLANLDVVSDKNFNRTVGNLPQDNKISQEKKLSTPKSNVEIFKTIRGYKKKPSAHGLQGRGTTKQVAFETPDEYKRRPNLRKNFNNTIEDVQSRMEIAVQFPVPTRGAEDGSGQHSSYGASISNRSSHGASMSNHSPLFIDQNAKESRIPTSLFNYPIEHNLSDQHSLQRMGGSRSSKSHDGMISGSRSSEKVERAKEIIAKKSMEKSLGGSGSKTSTNIDSSYFARKYPVFIPPDRTPRERRPTSISHVSSKESRGSDSRNFDMRSAATDIRSIKKDKSLSAKYPPFSPLQARNTYSESGAAVSNSINGSATTNKSPPYSMSNPMVSYSPNVYAPQTVNPMLYAPTEVLPINDDGYTDELVQFNEIIATSSSRRNSLGASDTSQSQIRFVSRNSRESQKSKMRNPAMQKSKNADYFSRSTSSRSTSNGRKKKLLESSTSDETAFRTTSTSFASHDKGLSNERSSFQAKVARAGKSFRGKSHSKSFSRHSRSKSHSMSRSRSNDSKVLAPDSGVDEDPAEDMDSIHGAPEKVRNTKSNDPSGTCTNSYGAAETYSNMKSTQDHTNSFIAVDAYSSMKSSQDQRNSYPRDTYTNSYVVSETNSKTKSSRDEGNSYFEDTYTNSYNTPKTHSNAKSTVDRTNSDTQGTYSYSYSYPSIEASKEIERNTFFCCC